MIQIHLKSYNSNSLDCLRHKHTHKDNTHTGLTGQIGIALGHSPDQETNRNNMTACHLRPILFSLEGCNMDIFPSMLCAVQQTFHSSFEKCNYLSMSCNNDSNNFISNPKLAHQVNYNSKLVNHQVILFKERKQDETRWNKCIASAPSCCTGRGFEVWVLFQDDEVLGKLLEMPSLNHLQHPPISAWERNWYTINLHVFRNIQYTVHRASKIVPGVTGKYSSVASSALSCRARLIVRYGLYVSPSIMVSVGPSLN